jgi:hypothetical protein
MTVEHTQIVLHFNTMTSRFIVSVVEFLILSIAALKKVLPFEL